MECTAAPKTVRQTDVGYRNRIPRGTTAEPALREENLSCNSEVVVGLMWTKLTL